MERDGLKIQAVWKQAAFRASYKVRIKSYNTAEFEDEEADLSDINVIGRVFWWSVLDWKQHRKQLQTTINTWRQLKLT